MVCAYGPVWHFPSKTQWPIWLNSSAPESLLRFSQNFPLQSGSHFLLFGCERTRQVTILQIFPLPLRPRAGNSCRLAQAAAFCWGFLFTHRLVRKKRSYTWFILNGVPFLEWCVGKVGWSDGEFSCLDRAGFLETLILPS